MHRWLLLFRWKGATGKKKGTITPPPACTNPSSSIGGRLAATVVLFPEQRRPEKHIKLQWNYRYTVSGHIKHVSNDVISLCVLIKLGRESVGYCLWVGSSETALLLLTGPHHLNLAISQENFDHRQDPSPHSLAYISFNQPERFHVRMSKQCENTHKLKNISTRWAPGKNHWTPFPHQTFENLHLFCSPQYWENVNIGEHSCHESTPSDFILNDSSFPLNASFAITE